jgi:NAD+ synthase
MICEDMWYADVARHLKDQGAEIETGLPLLYVNQVGGQDELVFDGASFVLNADGRAHAMPACFEEAYPDRWEGRRRLVCRCPARSRRRRSLWPTSTRP